jgi:hypothetical protein
MSPTDFNPDTRSLEEEFFARENARLLEKIRRNAELQDRREALRAVVSIKDESFLDRLLELGIGPETALALRLVPLVFVAWADGSMDGRERDAILRAAEEQGVTATEDVRRLLDTWLARRPEPHLLELWKEHVRELRSSFSPDERHQMRTNLLGAARQVAEAAGGFLGLTSKVSAAEREMLEELERIVGE